MALLCKSCNEKAFDVEEQVCKACGIVCDDIQFGIECNKDLSFKPFQSTASRKPRAEALNHGIDAVDFLCHQFNITADVKMETLNLLKEIYASRRKVGKSFKMKEDVGVLAGCCLLNIQRKHKLPVPINGFCSSLKCNKKKILKMTKVLQNYLIDNILSEEESEDYNQDISVVNSSVEDNESLESYTATLLSHAPEAIKNELIQKTTTLAKLADSCWLLTGRSKLGVVSAAAYLCWKSMNPKNKLTLPGFCREYSLNVTKARSRVPELKDMLLKLGANIPSKTANYVTDKNIIFHLGYILENSESLRNDLLSDKFTTDAVNQKEFETFRDCYSKPKPVKLHVSSYADDMNASDIEISDTEIASYIRTDKQISLVQDLRNMYDSDESLSVD
ncbi:transcription factor IIIB 50 kDa subunit [Parasteatoda tepidariorum]|uniref:transcription factor IIIB 50 kDa subunit n=1 Tax=Parasteatoda tepidariorum TaxID=114398 RepID=UPI00077FD5F4|nr:transcription factor IIIB 50 kDa subunit [Parasteatoda tepidariorum]XP_015929401.1 transcription factor IIIB 50 kDa subunit [Parasteatoda tepidariorum]XP_015929402.1 transcription factor IIIB 50 kDa subunit [Parasteatoda tepidariorum]